MAAQPISDRIGGVILAGGQSTRMGADKANLVLDGRTLLDRARHLLMACDVKHPGSIIVSGRPDEPDGLADTRPGSGPAHAARDALAALNARGFGRAIIIPVDMPRLTLAHIAPLLSTSGLAAAYADQPLPCVVDTTTIPGDETPSLFGLLTARGVTWAARPDDAAAALASVNTPEDWAMLSQPRANT